MAFVNRQLCCGPWASCFQWLQASALQQKGTSLAWGPAAEGDEGLWASTLSFFSDSDGRSVLSQTSVSKEKGSEELMYLWGCPSVGAATANDQSLGGLEWCLPARRQAGQAQVPNELERAHMLAHKLPVPVF